MNCLKSFLFDKNTSILALAQGSATGRRFQNIATRDEWERYEWLGEEQIELEQLFGISGRTRLEDGGGDKPTSSQ